MPERLDPLSAQDPGRPRPPLWCAALGLTIFLAGSLLAYAAFTAIWILAEPGRNTPLAMLGFFVLFAGTGVSSGLGLFTYHRLGRLADERRLRHQRGGAFTGDRRSEE